MVFHEITKRAVLEAMQHPRDLDVGLIDAYQARRALDYLVGFTLSPVLWRKLQGSRSAGRVQSVALRLICEREAEIEAFQPREYWSLEAQFTTPRDATFTARLTRLGDKKLDKFDLANEADAKRAVAAVEARDFSVDSLEKRQVQRHPAPPFATSTLQQEAARKLGFGADRTMRTAQRLFEGADARRRDGRPDHLHAHRQRADVRRGAGRLPAAHRGARTASATCPRSRAPIGPGPRTPRRRTRRSARPISRARRMPSGAGSTTTSAASTS